MFILESVLHKGENDVILRFHLSERLNQIWDGHVIRLTLAERIKKADNIRNTRPILVRTRHGKRIYTFVFIDCCGCGRGGRRGCCLCIQLTITNRIAKPIAIINVKPMILIHCVIQWSRKRIAPTDKGIDSSGNSSGNRSILVCCRKKVSGIISYRDIIARSGRIIDILRSDNGVYHRRIACKFRGDFSHSGVIGQIYRSVWISCKMLKKNTSQGCTNRLLSVIRNIYHSVL